MLISLSFNHYIFMSIHVFLIDQMSFRIKCTFDYFVLNCYFIIESVRWIQVHPRNSNICLSCWWSGTQVLARVVSSSVSPLIPLKIFLRQLVCLYICILFFFCTLFFNQGLRISFSLSQTIELLVLQFAIQCEMSLLFLFMHNVLWLFEKKKQGDLEFHAFLPCLFDVSM